MNCRHCDTLLSLTLADLGSAPPSNAYLTPEKLLAPEKWYPLRVMVCEKCWLVQTLDMAHAAELFDAEYAYFSSYSSSWLAHARRYVDEITARFGLSRQSHVVEVASNDGYLLQYVQAKGIPCTGIEPTASTAAVSRSKGIETLEIFFGRESARRLVAEGKQADLTAANNVLAHVPDINDFVGGFAILLKPAGVATFEFPHLLRLMAENQFDTIYHEHFSYLSLTAVNSVFAANGLAIFDVEEHGTHGGSLRVFAQRADTGVRSREARVGHLLEQEVQAGICSPGYYSDFQGKINRLKDEFLAFLLDAKRCGKLVAAYGAAAKGNTLMNYAGIRVDLIKYVVDRNPAKQGKYMPGSRIPIVSESRLLADKPDYLVILPWNIATEVRQQNATLAESGVRFVTAVPSLKVS